MGFWTYTESNTAVTRHFEDLAVNNYLFFKYICKRLCACVCVQKRVKNALSRTLLHLVFKIYKKRKLHIAQKYSIEQDEVFSQTNAIVARKVFKRQRYRSVTLHVSPKPQFQRCQRKLLPQKSKFCLHEICLSDLVLQLLKLFLFKGLA